jgi:hypothetical protein
MVYSVAGLAFMLLGREDGSGAASARWGRRRRRSQGAWCCGDACRGKGRGGGGPHRLAQQRRDVVVGSGPRDGVTRS